MTTRALRPALTGLATTGRSLRPVGEVLGFAALFLVLSLVCAAPLALLTGHRTVGIEYILPFTLLFLFLYQRWVHREGVGQLGIVFSVPYGRHLAVGFFASGVVATGVQGVQIGVGWMEIAAPVPQVSELDLAAGGLVVAAVFKLGQGVGEELIFRGYILRRLLLGYRSRLPAVGLTTLAFTAAHVPAGRHSLVLLNLFLLGLVCALAVLLTRSLWLAMGLHAGWNFWIDGIAFYHLEGLVPARVFQLQYHLDDVSELAAFKLTASAGLALTAAGLAFLVHRRDRRTAQEPLP